MMRVAILLLALVGCSTRYERARGIALAGVGLTCITAGEGIERAERGDNRVLLWGLVPSVALVLGGLLQMDIGRAADERDARERVARAKREYEAKVMTRDRLEWLVLRATASAGDCAQVGIYAREVRITDPHFYATVFARDAALAHCF